jgi:CubicO group peptidase (beta-lactamase class C family)
MSMGFEPIRAAGSTVSPTRRQWLGWAAGGAALTTLSSPARALWQATERFPALRAYVDEYVASRRLPGLIAAIGLGDAPLAAVAAGTLAADSSTPVDLDSLWRIYSQSKPVTGMAAMILVDEGKLTLDTPISEALPKFASIRVLARPDAPITETVALTTPITVRHLLTHTSGLGYGLTNRTPLELAWQERGIVPGQVSRMPLPGLRAGRTLGPIDVWADAVAELPLLAQPGTRWSYSAGLDLLGRVIEVVSGQPFDAFLKARLFDPLGMASTSFVVNEANVARLSSNYAPVGGSLFPIDPASTSIYRDAPSFPFGGAGLVSSARDYDRFLAMLMGEGTLGSVRILSPETARLAMSNILPAGTTTEGTFAAGQGFGAGGRVTLPGSREGEGIFGWGGAAGTIGFVDRRRRVRFGGYANYMPAEVYDFQRRVGEILYTDLAAMAGAAPAGR